MAYFKERENDCVNFRKWPPLFLVCVCHFYIATTAQIYIYIYIVCGFTNKPSRTGLIVGVRASKEATEIRSKEARDKIKIYLITSLSSYL